MTWAGVAIGGAAVIGSSAVGIFGASKASKAQAAAEKDLRRAINKSTREIEGYANEYVDFLTKLDQDFDPYDVEEAFNSLYEAVIQPMERDFDENVLPGIQAAYSGGIMGAGAGLSGAQASAETSARRDLSEKKAGLRFQERGQAIARNFVDYERRSGTAGQKFSAQTAAPMLRAQMAPVQYGAQTDTIAARLATTQALASGIGDIGSLGMQGANAYRQGQRNDTLAALLEQRNTGTGTP